MLPGVRLNFPKRSVSLSLGRPRATVNVGEHGMRGMVGVPGSGMSYSKQLVRRRRTPPGLSRPGLLRTFFALLRGR